MVRALLYCTKVDLETKSRCMGLIKPAYGRLSPGSYHPGSKLYYSALRWRALNYSELYCTLQHIYVQWTLYSTEWRLSGNLHVRKQVRVTRRSQGTVLIFFTVLQYFTWDCTVHCSNRCIMWYHTGSKNTEVLIEYNVEKRTLLTCINQNGYKVQWLNSIYNYCTSVPCAK